MARTRPGPRAPGWHPDPDDPAWLRHWDGRRWGTDRRPVPSWAGRSDGAADEATAGAAPPPRRRRWPLLAAIALAGTTALAGVGAWLGGGPDIPPRSVDDTAFTRRADAACAAALPALRGDRPQPREDVARAALARRAERAADGLSALVGDLRALPVRPADRAEVGRWLDDWDVYVALGRRYAATVRAGDDRGGQEVAGEGNAVSRRIFVFARSNGMPSCTP